MSQQIYISPNSWKELIKGKEETIQLINNSINQLDDKSNGIQLSSKIFENCDGNFRINLLGNLFCNTDSITNN